MDINIFISIFSIIVGANKLFNKEKKTYVKKNPTRVTSSGLVTIS